MALDIIGQNWLIVPATPLLPASESSNQEWLLTLTGVCEVTLTGTGLEGANNGWRTQSFPIVPDVQSPLKFALNFYGIPHPVLGPGALPVFNLGPDSAPFATVSGEFNEGVDFADPGSAFAPTSWEVGTAQSTDYQGNPANQVFDELSVTLNARRLDTINRVSYNLTLRGQIVFLNES
jgi:hypothetical protein